MSWIQDAFLHLSTANEALFLLPMKVKTVGSLLPCVEFSLVNGTKVQQRAHLNRGVTSSMYKRGTITKRFTP